MQFPGLSRACSQVLYRGRDSDGLCVLCPSQVQAAETRCFMSALSQVGHESFPLTGPSCCFLGVPWGHLCVCLLWGPDLRLQLSWQMSTVQDPRKMWWAARILLAVWRKMWTQGARLQEPLAFRLWLSHSCLSASGEGRSYRQPTCSPLSFSQSFFLWVHALGTFRCKVLFFFFFFSLSGDPTVWVLSHISSHRLSSGHSGLLLTLRTNDVHHTSLPSPHCLVNDTNIWATCPLAVAVRCAFCVFVIVFLFFLVMLPSEIPKLPTDMPMRGFPTVWKLVLLHDSLPRAGLYL